MAKRGLLLRSFWLVMPLVLLSVYGCDAGDTLTSPSPSQSITTSPSTSETTPPDTSTPPGTVIPFETFKISDDYYYRFENTAYVWVIPDIQQYHRPDGIERFPPFEEQHEVPEPPPEIVDFDYSHYFILYAFMGMQSVTGPNIEVVQIWQTDNIIYVEAYFDQAGPTYLESWSFPVDIVKVNKDNMTQFGEITFILLDQEGEERARTTGEIPQ